MSAVPDKLRACLLALALLAGVGGGTYVLDDAAQAEAERNEYVQAVAQDPGISDGVRVAMVLGSFYESSGRHIGTPYVDKNGRGQPLTVCNGITGPAVVAGQWYSPAACYRLERARYLQSEREARALLVRWETYGPFTQGAFIDFVHNKGAEKLADSTMRRKANAGDLAGACRENTRWNRGTVNGVSQVLPGLQVRGDANAELCTGGLT